MIPFVATVLGKDVLVVGVVWTGKEVMFVYIKPDRTFGYLPVGMMTLQSMHSQMPNIFEWPETAE